MEAVTEAQRHTDLENHESGILSMQPGKRSGHFEQDEHVMEETNGFQDKQEYIMEESYEFHTNKEEYVMEETYGFPNKEESEDHVSELQGNGGALSLYYSEDEGFANGVVTSIDPNHCIDEESKQLQNGIETKKIEFEGYTYISEIGKESSSVKNISKTTTTDDNQDSSDTRDTTMTSKLMFAANESQELLKDRNHEQESNFSASSVHQRAPINVEIDTRSQKFQPVNFVHDNHGLEKKDNSYTSTNNNSFSDSESIREFSREGSKMLMDERESDEHLMRVLTKNLSSGNVEGMVKIVKEQKTHDLLCPVCGSCITKRVILRKRKRIGRLDAAKSENETNSFAFSKVNPGETQHHASTWQLLSTEEENEDYKKKKTSISSSLQREDNFNLSSYSGLHSAEGVEQDIAMQQMLPAKKDCELFGCFSCFSVFFRRDDKVDHGHSTTISGSHTVHNIDDNEEDGDRRECFYCIPFLFNRWTRQEATSAAAKNDIPNISEEISGDKRNSDLVAKSSMKEVIGLSKDKGKATAQVGSSCSYSAIETESMQKLDSHSSDPSAATKTLENIKYKYLETKEKGDSLQEPFKESIHKADSDMNIVNKEKTTEKITDEQKKAVEERISEKVPNKGDNSSFDSIPKKQVSNGDADRTKNSITGDDESHILQNTVTNMYENSEHHWENNPISITGDGESHILQSTVTNMYENSEHHWENNPITQSTKSNLSSNIKVEQFESKTKEGFCSCFPLSFQAWSTKPETYPIEGATSAAAQHDISNTPEEIFEHKKYSDLVVTSTLTEVTCFSNNEGQASSYSSSVTETVSTKQQGSSFVTSTVTKTSENMKHDVLETKEMEDRLQKLFEEPIRQADSNMNIISTKKITEEQDSVQEETTSEKAPIKGDSSRSDSISKKKVSNGDTDSRVNEITRDDEYHVPQNAQTNMYEKTEYKWEKNPVMQSTKSNLSKTMKVDEVESKTKEDFRSCFPLSFQAWSTKHESYPTEAATDEGIKEPLLRGSESNIKVSSVLHGRNSKKELLPEVIHPSGEHAKEIMSSSGVVERAPDGQTSIQIYDDIQPQEIPHTTIGVASSPDILHHSTTVSTEWDILKSIVYGGLTVSITSLAIVSSAAGGEASTLMVIVMSLAPLIAGLFMILNNILDLDHYHKDQFVENVGHSLWFNGFVAVASYFFFGSLAPIAYGASFRTSSDNQILYKFLTASAVSLIAIILLAVGKAHVTKKSYFRIVVLYIITGFWASFAGFFAGEYIKKLLEKWGIVKDDSSAFTINYNQFI